MSKEQIIMIILVIIFWLINCVIVFGLYYYLKNNKNKDGTVLMAEVLPETGIRTDKMQIGELLVYISWIVIAFYIAINFMHSTYFRKEMLIAPILALFNARKRTAKALFIFFASAALLLNIFMTYMLIGVPVKAPILEIDNSKILLNKTTVSDLMKDGFQIYIKNEKDFNGNYEEILNSGNFEKYTSDKPIQIEKGVNLYSDTLSYSNYILAKGNCIIGSFIPYGNEKENINLDKCTIIQIKIDQNCLKKMKEEKIICKLKDMNLQNPLKDEEIKKTFEGHIWKSPRDAIRDDKFYGISFLSNNIFWNEYYIEIYLNDDNTLRDFLFKVKLPKK